MTISRRTALRLGLGAAAAATAAPLLSACGGAAAAGNTPTPAAFTYQLSWIKNVEWGGTWLADDRGYYRAEGINLTIAGGGPQVSVEPRIVAGKCLIGNTYGTGAAQTNRNGGNIRIIGVMLQKSPTILASPVDKPLTDPAQLAGKKIGVNAISQPVWTQFLAANNLQGKVTTVPVQSSLDPLTTGQVDAMLTYVTQTAALDITGFHTAKLYFADHGYGDITNAYGATTDALKNNRENIIHFMRGEIRGWQDFVADPAAGAKLAVQKYGQALGLNLQEQTIEAGQYAQLATADPIVKEQGLMRMSDTVKQAALKVINANGSPMTAADLFDDSLLNDVYQGKNRL